MPTLSLAVQYASQSAAPSRAQCRRWVKAAQQVLPVRQPMVLTLRFVDRAEGRQLNRTFRERNYPTNVLTFGYPDPNQVQADIVICVPVIEQEARRQKKNLMAHFGHMVIHGVFHATGLDHEADSAAARMEALERLVLARFRIGDPYA